MQKNSRTVQGEIEKALKRIFSSPIRLVGAGRTDAGVHALGQVGHFRTDSALAVSRIRKALNSWLPKDIVIRDIEEARPGFNSQFASTSKVYRYTLSPGDVLNPLMRNYAVLVPRGINLAAMKRAARFLVGRHDFKSFQASGSRARSSRRTISRIDIAKEGRLVYIDIEADGFLYNMVRNIIGTLIEVGRGRIAPASVKRILSARDRKAAGPTSPAKGLCLMCVKY